MHKFIIKDKDQLYTYTRFEDIPEVFDHVIEFLPDLPPDPHTQKEHDEIALWSLKLQELMRRERSASRN